VGQGQSARCIGAPRNGVQVKQAVLYHDPGVTETGSDGRVNRVGGEEGKGSHPARRATQQ